MIGLVRLYCYRSEEFLLVDAVEDEAEDESSALTQEGWDIDATITI